MRNVETSAPAFIFPQPSESVRSLPLEQVHELVETPTSSLINLTESTLTLDARSSHPPLQSNLSILMARYSSRSPPHERAGEEERDHHTPVVSSPAPTYQPQPGQEFMSPPTPHPISSPRFTEHTPLLPLSPFHHSQVNRFRGCTRASCRHSWSTTQYTRRHIMYVIQPVGLSCLT